MKTSDFVSEIPLIGQESLDDFASLTKESIDFARRYAKVMIPISLLLLVVTLFY